MRPPLRSSWVTLLFSITACSAGYTPVGTTMTTQGADEDGSTTGADAGTTGDETAGDGDGSAGDGDGDGTSGDGDGDGTTTGDGDGDGTSTGDGDGDGDVCGDGIAGAGEWCDPVIDASFPGSFRAFGDFDGDGVDDWVGVTAQGSDLVLVFVAGGPAYDTSAMTVSTVCSASCDAAQSSLAHVGDFDGDGNLDLVMTVMPATGQWPLIVSMLGDGSGSFALAQERTSNSGARNTSALGDVTGDGRDDVLVPLVELGGGFFLGRVNVYPGLGDGTFDTAITLEANRSQRAAAAIDLDDDGDLDVLGSGIDGVLSVWESDGAGGFGAVQDVPLSMALDLDDVGLVDLDGTPPVDVLVRQVSTFSTFSLIGTGSAASGWFVEDGVHVASSSRAVAPDLDADGDLDLVFHDAGAFRALRSDAALFDTPTFLGSASFTANVPVGRGDLNADGAPDVGAAEFVAVSAP